MKGGIVEVKISFLKLFKDSLVNVSIAIRVLVVPLPITEIAPNLCGAHTSILCGKNEGYFGILAINGYRVLIPFSK